MSHKIFKVALIGLGLHASYAYSRFIEKYFAQGALVLVSIVDIKSKEKIVKDSIAKNFKASAKNTDIFLLDDQKNNIFGDALPEELENYLIKLKTEVNLDGIIISTEPKAHMMYARWALRNNIEVLLDKPISAPVGLSSDQKAASQIYEDCLELIELEAKSQARLHVLTQRRAHVGYDYVYNQVKQIIKEYKTPITSINIYHGDGVFNLFKEINKDNHPYKYGYGKLMHSGYHFVDLYSHLITLNKDVFDQLSYDVTASVVRPHDYFVVTKFLREEYLEDHVDESKLSDIKGYGEIDAYIRIIQKSNDNTISVANLSLLQNTVSYRSWSETPFDTYRKNGRMRHESVVINISHILSIHIHSYQSGDKDIKTGSKPGERDHYEINIFRNSKLIGGETFESIDFGGQIKSSQNDIYYMGHNETGRQEIFRCFINREPSRSEIKEHRLTNLILSKVYSSISNFYERN